jgi:hypothetical protein
VAAQSSPCWSLLTVKALVAKGSFILSGSARRAAFDTDQEAVAGFQTIIAGLDLGAFAHQQMQSGEVFDVYGVVFRGRAFYLKFTVHDGEVVICISMHPPIRPLATRRGIIR